MSVVVARGANRGIKGVSRSSPPTCPLFDACEPLTDVAVSFACSSDRKEPKVRVPAAVALPALPRSHLLTTSCLSLVLKL